jgi:hypothetical protein
MPRFSRVAPTLLACPVRARSNLRERAWIWVYPRGMARKPVAPPQSGGAEPGRPKIGEPPARGDRGGTGERFGPLVLARVGKDDGRALIIYSHEELEERERT